MDADPLYLQNQMRYIYTFFLDYKSVSVMALAGAGSTLTGPIFSHFSSKDTQISESLEKSDSVESGFLNDSSEDETTLKMNDAATKIQAGFRGMKSRKSANRKVKERAMDDAATVIQTGFRSLQAKRKNNLFKQKSVNDNESEKVMDESATKIQAGYRGMKIRRALQTRSIGNNLSSFYDKKENEASFSRETHHNELFKDWSVIETTENGEPLALKLEDREPVGVRESSGKVARVGAIPFEMHESHQAGLRDSNDTKKESSHSLVNEENIELNINTESSLVKNHDKRPVDLDFASQEFDPDTPINIYVTEDNHECQEVELYLKEKRLDYARTVISRKRRNNLAPEFLEINPEGALPTLLFGKSTVKSRAEQIVKHIEKHVPTSLYPELIPCTSDTVAYQKYLLYSTKMNQIDITALEIGNHDKFGGIHSNYQLDIEDVKKEKEEMIIIKGKGNSCT